MTPKASQSAHCCPSVVYRDSDAAVTVLPKHTQHAQPSPLPRPRRAVHSTRASGTSSNHGDPCSDFPDMADTLPGITGDFGTKVSALVRRLKWLERNFPEQKSLVFSSFAVRVGFEAGGYEMGLRDDLQLQRPCH